MDRRHENNDYGRADLNNKTSNDPGLYRACPSKLTKRELEDVYYTILEANAKLNNSIKEKDEKIKMLTTKMYRQHSAQKVHEADGRKECCVNTQNTPKHTKGVITELKRANERMAERIRVLNLKLAAVAKDTAKRTQSRNIRDSNNLKIAPKENRPVVEIKKKHSSVTQTELACDVGRVCQENKSPTLMEELREKIATLEAELAKIQHEYSIRIDRLELEVQQYHIKHKEHVSEVKPKKRSKKANESAEQSQHNKEINLEAQSKGANKILRTAANHEACNKHTCITKRRDSKDMRLKIYEACECNRSIKIADDNKENRSYKDSTGVKGSENDLDNTNLNIVDTTSQMLRCRSRIVTQDSLDTHKHDNKKDNNAQVSLDTQRNEDEAGKRSEVILESLNAYGDASGKKEGVAQESFEMNRNGDVKDITGEIKKRKSLVACKHANESNEESLEAQRYDHVSINKKECDIASKSFGAQRPEDDSYNKSAKVAKELLDTCLNEDKLSYNRIQVPTEAFDICKCEDTTENKEREDIVLDALDARGNEEKSDNSRSEIVQESLDAHKCKGKEDNVVHEKEIIQKSEKDAQARHEKPYDDRESNDAQCEDVSTICTKCKRKYNIVSDSLDAPKNKDSDKYRNSSVIATQIDSNKTISDSINVHQPKEVFDYIGGQVAPEFVDTHRHEASFVKRNTHENRGDKSAPDKMNSYTHEDALEMNFQEQNDTHEHKELKYTTNAGNNDIAHFKATHENQLPGSSGLTHKDETNAPEILPINTVSKVNFQNYKACKCECFKYINRRKGSSKKCCIDSIKFVNKCDDKCQKDEFDHKDNSTLHKTDSKNAFNSFKSERMHKCNKCDEIIYGSESIDCIRSLDKGGVKKTEHCNSQSVDADCPTTPKTLCNDKLTNNSEIATKIVQDPMGQTITFTDACKVYTEKSYNNDFSLIGCQEKADTTKIKDSSSIKVPSISARVIEEDTDKQKDEKKYDNLMNDIDATSTSNISNTLEEFDTLRYGKDSNLKRTSYDTDVSMIRHTKSCTNVWIKNKTIKETGAEIQDDTIINEKVCGQYVSVDTSEPPIIADKGESQVSMSIKKESNQDEPIILPNAFVEPEILVKNLVNINEDQMKTVKELEHQLDAKGTSSHQAMLEEAEDFDIDDSTSKHSLKETKGPVVKIDSVEITNNGNRRTSVTAKNDQHNSLQIPGPIPVSSNSKKYIKKNMNKKSFRDNKKRQLTDLDKKSKVYNVGSQNNNNETKENIEDAKERVLATQTDENISQNDKMTETDVENSNLIAKETYFSQSTDDALPKHKPSKTFDASASMVVHCSGIKTVPSVAMDEKEIQVTSNIEATEPRRISQDGELPMLTPLDVQTYRNQFGILCFKTTPAERYVCCPCVRQTLWEKQSKGNQTEYQTQEIQTVNKIDQSTVTDQLRYNGMDDAESHVMTCTPPSSNTHQQCTGNDGIPKEPIIEQETNMNTKNIHEPNNRTSTQNGDKYASGTLSGDQCSISFTEMALNNKSNSRTAFKLDENGAPPSSDCNTDLTNTVSSDKVMQYISSRSPSNMKSSLDNMTKKLHSLSDELTLCKELLLRQQSREERNCMLTEHQHSADISLLDEQPSHALRPGQAKLAITEKSAPRCIFTLHIGTVVLSDEAVLSTIDKSLVLRWKFYDQNVSMTRMTTRRVMFFDFSTEYDILMSEEFFDYMKREEMKIVMCELNDQQDAFATCALPLRDALLHTNRRVDMSLALVAGSRMIDARNTNNSSDLLDTGDEMGVIDLWCMLRADPKLLPIINRAIARPSHQKKKSGDSLNVPQMTEYQDILEESNVNKKKQSEANYNGKQYQLSTWSSGMLYQDIDNIIRDGIRHGDVYEAKNYMSHLTLPQTVPIDTGIPLHLIKEGQRTSHSKRDGKENQTKTNNEASHGPEAVQSKRTDRRILQQKPQVLNSKALDKEHRDKEESFGSQIDDQKEEGIFINEVIANIKTPEDMQKALKQNPESQSLHCVSRLPKMEDELLSQPQSSMMSSGHFRDSRDKKRGAKQRLRSNQQSSDIKRGDSNNSYLPPLLLPEDNSEKTTVPLRYQNIAKLYGAKLEQAKRQVTIVPKVSTKPTNPSNNAAEVPQKDEPDQDQEAADYFKEELQITILWLALNEECEAMLNPNIQRVYVAYAFMGKSGADLETPFSLPKPKHHVDKCYFNFKKSFRVEVDDIPQLGHMVRCRAHSKTSRDPRDCIVFSVVSEPPEDPLGMATCEDIGYAYLYFGDLLAYSAGSPTYTEVIPVTACGSSSICGVLAIRVDGLDVLRRCLEMTHSYHVPAISKY